MFRVTSWVLSVLKAAQLEEWENMLYIHPRIIIDSVQFLLQFQNADGSFQETPHYDISLNGKMKSGVKKFNYWVFY